MVHGSTIGQAAHHRPLHWTCRRPHVGPIPTEVPWFRRGLGELLWVPDAGERTRSDQWGGVLPRRRHLCPLTLPSGCRRGIYPHVSYIPHPILAKLTVSLSWSDTTASTIGRLWGKYTPPLPAHFPLIPSLKFAPRKSLAGFLAATVTGFLICMTFWSRGSQGWKILESGWAGLTITSVVIGIGGAVAEALDLGLDDNLTLPILSGALMWTWLSITNLLIR
jgi:hypothetical protein